MLDYRKEEALQEGLQTAITVPLTVAKIVSGLWEPLKELAMVGNINCKSDLQVFMTSQKKLNLD